MPGQDRIRICSGVAFDLPSCGARNLAFSCPGEAVANVLFAPRAGLRRVSDRLGWGLAGGLAVRRNPAWTAGAELRPAPQAKGSGQGQRGGVMDDASAYERQQRRRLGQLGTRDGKDVLR